MRLGHDPIFRIRSSVFGLLRPPLSMSYKLPPISLVPDLEDDKKKELLDHLFEHCSIMYDELKPVLERSHGSYTELIEDSRVAFLSLVDGGSNISQRISEIIAAHPRLGPQKGKLSSHSSEEQKSLVGSPEETEKLKQLNELYEKTFPGLRYVVFVNGRPRSAIMENMKLRIQRGDISLEKKQALDAMCDIALDRAKKLQAKI